jgi:outer membrane biosynthesis protein TonB
MSTPAPRKATRASLGLGFEEQAAISIKTWRFNPATRNGEPVAVAMNVEVAFNLY